MDFSTIKQKVYNRIDETDYDEQIENIVEGAINQAYMELCKIDKRISRAYVPIINGIATLPENTLEIIKVIPELGNEDIVEGRNIITDKEGVLEILYNYSRDELVEDNEEPDLHINLQYALINYGVYKYYLHRKKDDLAEVALGDYQFSISQYEVKKDNIEGRATNIVDVLYKNEVVE